VKMLPELADSPTNTAHIAQRIDHTLP
jgi:hypothetical protein